MLPYIRPLTILLALHLLISAKATETRSKEERIRLHPQIFQFPYNGRGDPDHTFRHPYRPSAGGDPIDAFFTLGSTVIANSPNGRDVVRLTSANQANQGLVYGAIRTESNNFNGYFDIQMNSARGSHETADGMGFFFTKDLPTVGSAMGITHHFQGLGLIIDTFSNSRSRQVPYLYAYVSDGVKEWNPNTDGSDTELTRGCQIEMNTKVRIYVQLVDGDLHVGVAMNPHAPHRWHSCFKVSNVQLPFSDGGFFVFAAETGHFYAIHEVHDSVFIDESPHSGEGYRSPYSNQQYGDQGQQQQQQHQQQQQQQQQTQQQQQQQQQTQQQAKPPPPNANPNARIHKSDDPHKSLSGSLDLQVYEVFNSMSGALRNLGDKEATETKLRLEGVRDVTSHLIQEMERQSSSMGDLIESLRHLKETSKELTVASERFSTQLKGMHSSIISLREKSDHLTDSHEDLQADIFNHHADVHAEQNSGKGNGFIIMFFVIQILLGAAVYFANKMTMAARKMGRMV